MPQINWEQVPAEVANIIRRHARSVTAVSTVGGGLDTEIVLALDTATGRMFVTGSPTGRAAATQRREAAVNPFVRYIAPRLLWQEQSGGWDVLAFEHVAGVHADYSPGSPDLLPVAGVLRLLCAVRCPDSAELLCAQRRWADYLDDPADAHRLGGDTLLHSDLDPQNVLVHNGVARLVRWPRPTRGAAFIDPACWAIRLVAAGHTPQSADEVAGWCPAYAAAPRDAVTVFAVAASRMWRDAAAREPAPWTDDLAAAAQAWSSYVAGADRVAAGVP